MSTGSGWLGVKAIMDSERTACWPRHKRRVYAQAEGFENPQRADYRRLLNFLAHNSGLCHKAILHSSTVPEFAAVRTILNRKLKDLDPNPEVDLLARELLHQPLSEVQGTRGIEDLVRDDSQEIDEILNNRSSNPWDDLSDLLDDVSSADDLFHGDALDEGAPETFNGEPQSLDDLLHGKPQTRGRFGRRRVNRSLSSMVIEHVLKATETDQVTDDHETQGSTAIDSIQSLEASSETTTGLVEIPDNFESIDSVVFEPDSVAVQEEEAAPQTSHQNFDPKIDSESDPSQPDPANLSILLSEQMEFSPAQTIEPLESKEPEVEQPVSQAQLMLENWFRALDNTLDTTNDHYTSGERTYADDLAENPGELLKQLEKIARSSDPLPKEPKKARSNFRKQPEQPCHVPMSGGRRKEVYANGAIVIKDAIGKVMAVRSRELLAITFSYDPRGNLKSFSRYHASGALHSTGERDHHGVIVRDPCGRVRAQGESMSCDPSGCLTIRKMDGQFWSVDLVRGIHTERRILEDLNGHWSSLTALLTYDGFRMATRFQELKDSYRRYGDWLSQSNSSIFRFYGRDGSMIQFNSDEELQSLRPSSMKPPGTKFIDEELKGRRKARTAWDSVHEYVSQYLAIL